MTNAEASLFKNGFKALNGNLTDIAKSLRKLAGGKEDCFWRTVEEDGLPSHKWEYVLAIVSFGVEIDKIPYVMKYDHENKIWIFHMGNGYADRPASPYCKVLKWAPIPCDKSDILYAGGNEVGRRHRYGE